MANRSWTAAVIALAASAMAIPASAQVSGVTTTGGSAGQVSRYTLGYNFTVNQAATVYALGTYDAGANGLAESHAVGLWNSAGTLVASATVPSGTIGPLLDSFRYTNLATPYVLTVGQSYSVGAFYGTTADSYLYGTTATSASEITYNSDRFTSGSALTYPNGSSNSTASNADYFGGNVLLRAAATPEPSSWALMILGFGVVGGALRRQKRMRIGVRFAGA